MRDRLKIFVSSYSHNITVDMLIDLCSVVGIKPSQLLDDNNKDIAICTVDQKSKITKNSKVQSTSEKLLTNTQSYHNIPEYLTVDEVAKIFKVKKITVWSWIREKKLNAIRAGREYRVRPEDINTFNEVRYTRQSIK
ncbi:helix-turn-helix domain-containing protein [uncultured Sporomusa sp.]|uniref:helix-turn-helix domain-containing protein n=1 Tax=uncultured Sporomusa sp. TaxID=307249 RepID=UPI0025902EFA|nr:helix-turn-helix domain-containing protein [uncultured Sporomusa sp.]